YGVCYSLFCFFFQAEDGIRDFHVTGVQTCALPIIDGIGRERRNATALDGGDGLLEGTALFECQIRHVGLLNGRILMDALSHRSDRTAGRWARSWCSHRAGQCPQLRGPAVRARKTFSGPTRPAAIRLYGALPNARMP